MDKKIKIQNNLVLIACDKRWPYFIQQLNLLFEMGMAPKAVLIEPHQPYVKRRLKTYIKILKTKGIKRLIYRIKIDILDNFEKIGIIENPGREESLKRANYPYYYTCGKRSSEWQTLQLDDFNLKKLGIEIIYCGNNSDKMITYLNRNNIEFVLAGAAQVLQKHVFNNTNSTFLNMHPGLLPYMRGMHAEKWSLYFGINPAATLHVMDADVDTGPIIATDVVPIKENDTFASLRVKAHERCLILLKNYLPLLLSKKIDIHSLPKQDLSVGKTTEGMSLLRFLQCNRNLKRYKKISVHRKDIHFTNPGIFISIQNEKYK